MTVKGDLGRWHTSACLREAAVCLGLISACGPSVDSPPVVLDWMLGTFSAPPPGEHFDAGSGVHYVVREDMILELRSVTENGVKPLSEHTWRPSGTDVFTYYYEGEEDPDEAFSWFEVTRGDDCRVVEDRSVRADGVVGLPQQLYRGVICVDDITEPCPPEEAECGTHEIFYWCEEPPPCEDDD